MWLYKPDDYIISDSTKRLSLFSFICTPDNTLLIIIRIELNTRKGIFK